MMIISLLCPIPGKVAGTCCAYVVKNELSSWLVALAEKLRLVRNFNPVTYGSFKDTGVDVLQGPEPDAIPGYARFAQIRTICLSQVILIRDTKDIDGDPGLVGAQPDLKKLPGFSTGIFYRVTTVSDCRVADGFIFAVLAIVEPQPATWYCLQNKPVQRQHLTAFGFRLTGQVLVDLFLYVHRRRFQG